MCVCLVCGCVLREGLMLPVSRHTTGRPVHAYVHVYVCIVKTGVSLASYSSLKAVCCDVSESTKHWVTVCTGYSVTAETCTRHLHKHCNTLHPHQILQRKCSCDSLQSECTTEDMS